MSTQSFLSDRVQPIIYDATIPPYEDANRMFEK